MTQLLNVLRKRFPDADIRSPRPGLVLIIMPAITIGCEIVGAFYEAKIIALENGIEYDKELIAKFSTSTADALADKIAPYIR